MFDQLREFASPRFGCRSAFALTIVIALGVQVAIAQEVESRGMAGMDLALRRIGEMGSVLYVTAHPDDENNGVLSRLSRGMGLRVGLLTLTRGEGGQNEIGSELGTRLGVLRSGELEAVHRRDGVEQFFSLAYEFGYSFSVEETFEKWGREETLGDIVRVIRRFRPDIILTMSPDGAGGGQHHQASARLAREAFDVAADSSRFVHHIAKEGLRVWQARHVLSVPFQRGPNVLPSEGASQDADSIWLLDTGVYDPVLGMSYAEHGASARNSHRCQGMNRPPVPGEQWVRFHRLASSVSPSDARGGRDRLADELRRGYDDADWLNGVGLCREGRPASVVELRETFRSLLAIKRTARVKMTQGRVIADDLLVGLGMLRSLVSSLSEFDDSAALLDLRFQLEREIEDWSRAALQAHHFALQARIETPNADGLVVSGEEFEVEVALVQRVIRRDVSSVRIEVPRGWTSELISSPGASRLNATMRWRFRVRAGSSPWTGDTYWRRPVGSANRVSDSVDYPTDRFVSDLPAAESWRPFRADLLRARVEFSTFAGPLLSTVPVEHREFDVAIGRERRFGVKQVPRVAVSIASEVSVLPMVRIGRGVEVRVDLRYQGSGQLGSNRGGAGQGGVGQGGTDQELADVSLSLPDGWRCVPESHSVQFIREGEARQVRFQVFPASGSQQGLFDVTACAQIGRETFCDGYDAVDYHHVSLRHVRRTAITSIRLLEVSPLDGKRVGYVMGVGDAVPEAIQALGADVRLLGATELASGDLSVFDVIVTGIRAFKDRRDLVENHQRLLDYVSAGGLWVCQYNKYEFNTAQYGPFPAEISRPHDRVTDENAAVKVLKPSARVFQQPNRIGADDWRGWVQERGLYFWGSWDERYVPLLEIEDPFPYNPGKKQGALVAARFGKGRFVYTGLAFFRQLPAGVPGAYRLWANLLSWTE